MPIKIHNKIYLNNKMKKAGILPRHDTLICAAFYFVFTGSGALLVELETGD
jgi:hypothetical protein